MFVLTFLHFLFSNCRFLSHHEDRAFTCFEWLRTSQHAFLTKNVVVLLLAFSLLLCIYMLLSPKSFIALRKLPHTGRSFSYVCLYINLNFQLSARTFMSCERSRLQWHNRAHFGKNLTPMARLQRIHLDTVTGLPVSWDDWCSHSIPVTLLNQIITSSTVAESLVDQCGSRFLAF